MEDAGFFKRHRVGVRWAVRLLVLVLAIFLLVGGPLPEYVARVIPAMSPLSSLSAFLAHRAWYVSLAWSLPAVLLLGLALWKGRFFCRWICPLGTLYSVPSQFSRKRLLLKRNLGGYVFWFTVFAAVAGLPLVLFLDPLSTFTRLGAMSRGTAHLMSWVPGVLIPLMLLLSFLQPGIWCVRLCPLGYLLELVQLKKKTGKVVSKTRRELLTGLALGVPLAMLFRNVARASETSTPVLPPGAKDLDNFSATCIRCYACINACPTGVLTVRKKGGVAELCLPEMDFLRADGAYCEQYCNACTQVCPTGAIRSMTLEEKQRRKVATASIIREACLAWEDRLECVACDEFCGYKSIEMRPGKDGIPKPVINPRKCRGCGACQNICPAIREGNAVAIQPLYTQQVITDADESSSTGSGCGNDCRQRHGHGR